MAYSSEPDRPFTGNDIIGVVLTAVAGGLSCVLVTLLLLHVFSVALLPLLHKKGGNSDERVFLRKHLGIFVVCLLLSDFVQAISGLIQSRWASAGGITAGTACTAQAVLLQLGDNGTAIWNAVVAIHTFMTVVLGKRMSTWTVTFIVIWGWGLNIFLAVLGPALLRKADKAPFYGIAGNWCFITSDYALERIMLHYFPMFLSAFIILVLYTLLFLTLRGTLVVDTRSGMRFEFHWNPSKRFHARSTIISSPRRSETVVVGDPQASLRVLAKKMLWYPIAYITLIIPISICRFVTLNGRQIPMWPWMLGMCCLFLMGFANTIIYCSTRRLGPSVPWFAAPIVKSGPDMQIFVDRVTINDTGVVKVKPQPNDLSASIAEDIDHHVHSVSLTPLGNNSSALQEKDLELAAVKFDPQSLRIPSKKRGNESPTTSVSTTERM